MEKSAVIAGCRLLKALANPKRLEILWILRQGEQKVGQLVEKMHLSQSALSQHLAVLRSAGAVVARRQAQNVFYSSETDAAVRVLDLLDEVFEKNGRGGNTSRRRF